MACASLYNYQQVRQILFLFLQIIIFSRTAGEGLLWCKFLAVCKEVAKVKIFTSGFMLTGEEKTVQFAVSSVCIHALILRNFLGDNVTKLIMVNIAIIKSGHNLSSYLKKLRYNLHTVEMQRYGSVSLPNADTCVIHILCQDSKHIHLSGKFPRTSAQASSAPSTLHSHPCSSRQPLL